MPTLQYNESAMHRPVDGLDLSFLGDDVLAAAKAAVEHFAVRPQLPIVLDHDWALHGELNDFVAMIARTERSHLTWLTYAREAEVFCRYVRVRRGKDLGQLGLEDLWAYKAERLSGPLPVRLSTVAWNKVAAIILRLLRFRRLSFDDLNWRSYRASVSGDVSVRMISLEHYAEFQSRLTLRRNPLRNKAFSEVLVTTGIRCSEGALLLRREMPTAADFRGVNSIGFRLPGSIAKRSRDRSIAFSKRVIREYVEPYVDEERSHAAARAIDTIFGAGTFTIGELERYTDYIFFELDRPGKIRIIAGHHQKAVVPMANLLKHERPMLVEVRALPNRRAFEIIDFGSLWISERGTCPTASSWLSAFSDACKPRGRGERWETYVTDVLPVFSSMLSESFPAL